MDGTCTSEDQGACVGRLEGASCAGYTGYDVTDLCISGETRDCKAWKYTVTSQVRGRGGQRENESESDRMRETERDRGGRGGEDRELELGEAPATPT